MSLWQSITAMASNNQIFSGAVAGGAVLGLLNYLRPIPYMLFRFVFNRCSTLVSIHSSDSDSFAAANEWAKTVKADRWARTYRLRNTWNCNTREQETSLTPHYGSYWFFWNGRLCNLHTFKEEAAASGSHDGVKTRDFFDLRIIGRSKTLITEFLEQVEELVDSFDKDNVTIKGLYNSFEAAETLLHYKRGSSKAPILKEGQLEQLVTDIKTFQQAEEEYTNRGIPYNRGYILHGPPGTGKTSIIRYLADACKSRLVVVQSSDLLSSGLASRFSGLDKGTIVVMEDLDRVLSQAKLSKKQKGEEDDGPSLIDMSGFLNCLDGLTAPSGLIFIITANDISKLDPAIMRPGRVDVIELIDVCDEQQANKLHERFFGKPGAVFAEIAARKKLSPAKCQEIFIKTKNEQEAIKMAKELPECATHIDGQIKQAE